MKLTPQKMFNKAWKHFLVEKEKPGWDKKEGECIYRGSNCACNLGIFLGKEYKPSMEGFGAEELIPMLPAKHPLRSIKVEFLRKFQMAHDDSAWDAKGGTVKFREFFKENMIDLAGDFGLKIPK